MTLNEYAKKVSLFVLNTKSDLGSACMPQWLFEEDKNNSG